MLPTDASSRSTITTLPKKYRAGTIVLNGDYLFIVIASVRGAECKEGSEMATLPAMTIASLGVTSLCLWNDAYRLG